jgi:hypothetical protein
MIVMFSFLITVGVIYAVVQPPDQAAEEDRRELEPFDDGQIMGQLISMDRAIRRFEPAPNPERINQCEPETVLKVAG